jgi:hypothetical protein
LDDWANRCGSSTTYLGCINRSLWYGYAGGSVLLMPKYQKYFIVEYRIPIKIEDVETVAEAVSRAKKIIDRQHGISPDNWFARIFEYSIESEDGGPAVEYFYNPNSTSFREITKNIGYHNDMVEKGIDPTKEEDDEG